MVTLKTGMLCLLCMKDYDIVGHVPRELSKTCWHFIARVGEISCKITGQKQRYVLLEGGLEIPCIYTFRGKKRLIDKLKVVMNGQSPHCNVIMLIHHQCQIKVHNQVHKLNCHLNQHCLNSRMH